MSNNPWAGLASYQDPASGSTLLFCGRDNESYDLAALVDDNIFCTLYGKSGTGKTSLLNAGMFPRLRDMGYLPLSIRLGMEAMGSTFQQCIAARLGKAATLQTADTVPLPADDQDEQWLWAWFARTRFVDAEGKVRFPVLVFDQFEEVFRSRRAEAETLLRQIHFMMDPSHSLGDDYDYNFRFLASIREDDLYLLEDSLDRHFMGDMKQCRYRLNALSDEGARDVILKPGEGLFAAGEQDAIVDTVIGIARSADGSINTNILSLVCSRIYDHYQRSGDSHISLDLVKRFVSSNPFEQFYNEVTENLGEKEKQFIEDRLVDAAGRRGSVSEPDFEKNVPNGAHLMEGTGRILQRVASGTEGRSYRIELIHDSFCAPLADQKLKRAARRRRRVIAALSAVALVVAAVAAYIVVASIRNARQTREILIQQEKFYAYRASQLLDEGDTYTALLLLNELVDPDGKFTKIPLIPEAECQMRRALTMYDTAEWQLECVYHTPGPFLGTPTVTPDGKYLLAMSFDDINVYDYSTGVFIRKIVTGDHFNFSGDYRRFETSQDSHTLLWLPPEEGGYHKKLKLFDIETGEMIKKLDYSFNISSFLPHGSNIIISSRDLELDDYGETIEGEQHIQAFDMHTNDTVLSHEYVNAEHIRLAQISQNGTYLVSAFYYDFSQGIIVHDNHSGKLLRKYLLDKDVISWKCLNDKEILIVMPNALYIYDIPKGKTHKVVDGKYDMKITRRPQVSKDKFMVTNGDTAFVYNINDYTLVAYYVIDREKIDNIYLSYLDNHILPVNQKKGIIYRLKHTSQEKKKDIFPDLKGNYTQQGAWEIFSRRKDTTGYDTNYAVASKSNGWYYWFGGHPILKDSILVGLTPRWDHWTIYDLSNKVVKESKEGFLLSTSPNGRYMVFYNNNRNTEYAVFDTKTNQEIVFDTIFEPLFCDYNNDFYCKYRTRGQRKSTISDYDSIFKYDITNNSAVFCMRIPSSYGLEASIGTTSTLDNRFYGIKINNDSVDSIRYVILDTKRNRLFKTKTYFYDAKIIPDGKHILTSEPDGYLRLRRTTHFTVVDSCLSRMSQIKAISPDGKYAVIYPDNSDLMELWNLHPLCFLTSYSSPIFRYSGVKVLFANDGKSFMVLPDIYNLDGRVLIGRIPILSQLEIKGRVLQTVGSRRLTMEEKSWLLK